MPRLLHIQASPMGGHSFSLRAAEAFLQAYKNTYDADEVETLDLWNAKLPDFDYAAAVGKYKHMRGQEHTEKEAAAWRRVVDTIEHFKTFDKYVVSAPMWNFSVPYRLKQYIDIIVQPGLTFSFTPEAGFAGLVTGRPLQLILARGGEYAPSTPAADSDYQRPYLERIFEFIGFDDIHTCVIEPTMGSSADQILSASIERLQQEAVSF